MAAHHTTTGHMERRSFERLEHDLITAPDNTELLHAYFHAAVFSEKTVQARAVLADLQHHHPRNHAIRRLSIALCLQEKDYSAAMDAVETLLAFSSPDDDLIDSALAIRSHVGPRAVDAPSPAQSSISLCMIVRNEQAFLGPCLNSIKGLVDEIIVVDTGSGDRSADIARIYGARVYNAPWQDDFASARNISLDKAGGDWILILDADEIIAPEDFAKLKQLAVAGRKRPKAYSFQTRNYLNLANAMEWQPNDRSYPQQEAGIGWFPTDKVRLFPNLEQIRFEFPVHEIVDANARKAGVPIQACEVPIHHYGHLNETKNQRKAETYFKLGYAKLDQLGNNLAAIRELAVQAGQLGRWREAIDLWQRLLVRCPDFHEAYANLAGAFWQLGQYEQGVDYSKKAIQADPLIKEGHYNLAVNLFMRGQAEEAVKVLQEVLDQHAQYLQARFLMAAALSVIGKGRRGSDAFRQLKMEMSEQVLSIAVSDLVRKMESSGLSEPAEAVKASAGVRQ